MIFWKTAYSGNWLQIQNMDKSFGLLDSNFTMTQQSECVFIRCWI